MLISAGDTYDHIYIQTNILLHTALYDVQTSLLHRGKFLSRSSLRESELFSAVNNIEPNPLNSPPRPLYLPP